MAKRSLQASQEGARTARKAFERKGWTQENLAAEIELKTRQPIWRFFTCRPIERHIFVEICHILDLNWWEIAEQPPEFLLEMVGDISLDSPLQDEPGERRRVKASVETSNSLSRTLNSRSSIATNTIHNSVLDNISNIIPNTASSTTYNNASSKQTNIELEIKSRVQFSDQSDQLDINLLVTQSRTKCQGWIEDRCGVLRFLNTSSPVPIDEIYTPVDVVFSDSRTNHSRIPALQAVHQHSRLRILGRAGSGKTSLLNYLAVQCIRGELGADRVPLLIRLENFLAYTQHSGRSTLVDFICYELSARGIDDAQLVITLLTEGKFLVLLDGIDEVAESDSYGVYREVNRFMERYYSNQVIMASRLTSHRFEFPHFTDVEIAEFTDDQLAALSTRWFQRFSKTVEEGKTQATDFLQQIHLPINHSIAFLVRFPLLLNAIAQFFQSHGELASYHPEIYAVCLNILLERWDQGRGIDRSRSRLDIPVALKEAVLTQLAAVGFQQNDLRFRRQDVLQWIETVEENFYLSRSVKVSSGVAQTAPQTLSREILAALEDQGLFVEQADGFFAFAFAGFHNYFAARWVVQQIQSDESDPAAIAALTQGMVNLYWQEVILLAQALIAPNPRTTEMLRQMIDRLGVICGEQICLVDRTQQIHSRFLQYQTAQAGYVFQQLIIQHPDRLKRHATDLLVFCAVEQQYRSLTQEEQKGLQSYASLTQLLAKCSGGQSSHPDNSRFLGVL